MLHKKHITISVFFLCALVVCLLWHFCHWGQLNYHEQLQMFLLTPSFFCKTVFCIGGFADYVSQFFTQFFINHWLGAGIIAFFISMVQVLSWRLIQRINNGVYGIVLSIVPLVASYCVIEVAESLLTSLVALVVGLLCSNIVVGIKRDKWRYIMLAILSAISYMLAGSIASITTLFCVMSIDFLTNRVCVGRAILFTIALMIEWIIMVCASHLLGEHGIEAYAQGVYYLRTPMQLSYVLFADVALIVASIFLAKIKPRSKNKEKVLIIVTLLLIVFLSAKATNFCFRQDFEEMQRYDYLCRQNAWDAIIATADKENPKGLSEQNYLNLALAQKGQLAQKAFHFRPQGPESLFVPFVRHPSMSISAGEVFYHLGLTSVARRFFAESQGAITNHYLSVRYTKRMAEIDAINGDWNSAAKYLRVLQKTLFYREWATELLNIVENGKEFAPQSEYAEIKSRLVKERFISSEEAIDVEELVKQQQNNRYVWDYRLMFYLFDKRMDLFTKAFYEYAKLFQGDLPQVYQEATLISWVMAHKSLNGYPYSASQYNIERLRSFMSSYNSSINAEEQLERLYSNTLWYYLFFY